MTEPESRDFPDIDGELPEAIGPFELTRYSDTDGRIQAKYELEEARLMLESRYNRAKGDPEASIYKGIFARFSLIKEREGNGCRRQYTEEYDSGGEALKELKKTVTRYLEDDLFTQSDYHYPGAMHRLLDEYAVDYSRQCSVHNWPEEFKEADVGLYDKDADELVADFDIMVQEDEEWDRAFLISPANYTSPMEKPPLSEIEEPNALPEPGRLLYELFDTVAFIGLSPHPETTNMGSAIGMVKELHLEHDYHPDLAWEGYLEEAERRGDLTEDPKHLDDQSESPEADSATENKDRAEMELEDWL